MTPGEAIEIIEALIEKRKLTHHEYQALQIAIDALERMVDDRR